MYVIRKWPQLHSIVNVLLTLSVCYKEVAGAYLSVRIVRYLSFYVTYLRHRSWIQATWYVQCMLYKSFWLPYKTQSLLVLNNVFVVLVQLQHGMWCLDVYRCNFEVCRKSGHVHFCILFNNNNIISILIIKNKTNLFLLVVLFQVCHQLVHIVTFITNTDQPLR